MEASALPPSVAVARTHLALGAPLLRFRSDEQLVSLFRSGSDEAFRAIHDRYRQRMFAYTRQMLAGSAVDPEDAVQEIFVRAYAGLRASDRELALRAWLYRIAHNRCIDELRRPQSVAAEIIPATVANSGGDPVMRLEQRDALQRLIADVQRLPDQQRSALLMRELGGMTYADIAGALAVSVPAVKSLLVRARVGLAQASEARDTACAQIRDDLIVAHDRGVRASGLARRHLRDCPHCRQFRREVRGVSRQLAAFAPVLGPIGVIAKLLGIGGASGGGAAGSSAFAGGGATAAATAATATAAGGVAGTGALASVGTIAGGHVVTLLAAAVVTAGGALELQHIAPPTAPRVHHHHAPARLRVPASDRSPAVSGAASSPAAITGTGGSTASAPASPGDAVAPGRHAVNPFVGADSAPQAAHRRAKAKRHSPKLSLSETVDPDHWDYLNGISGGANGLRNAANPTGSSTPPASTATPAPGADGTSPAPPPTTSSLAAPSGTPSPTPTSTTSATSAGATPVGSGTATPSTGGGSGGAASTSSAGSAVTGSAGSTSYSGKSKVTVTPAASTGSIDPRKRSAASRPRGHGTIAVFTMTGN